MKGTVTAIAALLALAACGGETTETAGDTGAGTTEAAGTSETAETVLFVGAEAISIRGEVEMVTGADGGPIPYLWAPGTIVVFRADQTIAGRSGRAGRAYRIQEGGALSEIGPVDLAQSDDELAAEYGVAPGPPEVRMPE